MTETLEAAQDIHAAHQPAGVVAELRSVTKRYSNGVTALSGLSLALHAGEVTALLGPNGAGKSTAVRLLMGLSSPTQGSVRVFGSDPRNPAARLRTGVMLQVGRAPEMMRVREHLVLFRGYYPRPMEYAELVRIAGLQGIEDRFFGQLSGGQKQRLLFALALAGDPDLIFLDEPTTGLDIESRRSLWAAVRQLAARGKTILLTTHYLEEADSLADRIVVLREGHIVREGTPQQIKGVNAMTTIRCVTIVPDGQLLQMTGVARVERTQHSTVITTDAPEQTLRSLLPLDPTLHSLAVQPPALEDAFMALMAEDTSAH